jgi:uncharacterized membrane protein YfcA
LTLAHGIILAVAGFLAGAVNSLAGGGSFISFPALLAVGYPAVTANMTNTIALWPGYVGATSAYRRELTGQRSRVIALGVTSLVGGTVGSVLMLTTPGDVFKRVVPWLILLACILFALQPLATSMLAKRDMQPSGHRSIGLHAAVLFAAVYGAYFGAGVGIVLLALLGLTMTDSLQRLNGLKQILVVLINTAALVAYGVFGSVAWPAVGIMAVTSLVGGRAGGAYSRHLNPTLLRVLVLAFGITVTCVLFARQ